MPEGKEPRLLVWRAGGRRCAAGADGLEEIVPAGAITPVPGVPAPVMGLANVRGRVVTVVDGRRLVGVVPDTPPAWLVLARVGARTVALAVDEVEDLAARLDGVQRLDLDRLLAPLFPD